MVLRCGLWVGLVYEGLGRETLGFDAVERLDWSRALSNPSIPHAQHSSETTDSRIRSAAQPSRSQHLNPWRVEAAGSAPCHIPPRKGNFGRKFRTVSAEVGRAFSAVVCFVLRPRLWLASFRGSRATDLAATVSRINHRAYSILKSASSIGAHISSGSTGPGLSISSSFTSNATFDLLAIATAPWTQCSRLRDRTTHLNCISSSSTVA